jgi:hypothetical protein
MTNKTIIPGRAILIEGPSGRGKSTSLRNLDPTETLLFNTERKTLPWRGGAGFPQLKPKTVKEIFDFLDKYADNPKIKQIVTDSFSAFSDMLVAECRILKTGWDVWDLYNRQLYQYFLKMKRFVDNGKHVIVLGHDETIQDEAGSGTKRLKTKGKEWEGVTEKEFDIVLWADATVIEEGNIKYEFVTQTNGKTPAKSPMGMLPIRMPNDVAEVIKLINEYDK